MVYFKENLGKVLLLLLLTLLIYANVFQAPFHFDDLALLLENPHIRSFADLFSGIGADQRKFLTFFTFAVNFQYSPFNPFWYRLINIFLHIFTALLIAGALRYLFRAPFFRRTAGRKLSALAWGAAFIFCVHPLQTDAVTYIWQRSEILSGFFYAVILLCYWKGRTGRNRRFILYAACFLFVGLYAKGSVMTAPIMIVAAEILFFDSGRWIIKNKKRCLLIVFLCIAASLLLDKVLFNINFSADGRYFLTQGPVIWKYIQLTVIPAGQSIDHGFVWAQSFWEPRVALAFLGLLGLFAVIVVLSRRYRLACFGAAWFFIYLLPTSSLISISSPIYEHRLYFSLAGFGLMLSDVVLRLTRQQIKKYWIVMALIISVFSILTVLRNQLWQTQIGLMEDAVEKSPNYARPIFTLGSYYLSDGRFDDAEKMFKKCIAINPHFADAYNNLGVIRDRRGDSVQAISLYRRSIENDPKYIDPYLNLSRIYYSEGRIDLAWDWIAKALEVNPDHRVYAYAAFLQMKAGNFDDAKRLLDTGFAHHKSSARLFYVQGLWHLYQEDLESAAVSLNRAVYYAPKWVSPFNDLGVVYFMQKKYELARQALEQAHHLTPRDASIYLNLANVYHELGQYQKAEQYYQTSQYEGFLRYIPANFDGKDILLLDNTQK